ncbi:hypothetical protein EZV73_27035 [Acidaminobacter sp. JC074]|uniref:hypothetical protein n=1 Tax=Acidaminobacter sp. JC074 TaxID=2530199 RepID=UPI001F1086ED|nr:hypothetical protein [Acidaminobacter sp. JC074]MCH4891254.1 hypothetical protein [Acidaminobacter sp. JC074]
MKKKLLTITLVFVLIFTQSLTTVFAEENNSDEYYSETEYFYGEDAANLNIFNYKEPNENLNLDANILSAKNNIVENFSKPVVVAKKRVYYYNKYDEKNNLITSRLMNKNEVIQYKITESYRALPLTSTLSKGFLTPDSEERGACDFYLGVYELSDGSYVVQAHTDWPNEYNAIVGGEVYPHNKRDFISLSWGGYDEAFTAKSKNFYGKYYDGTSISGSREESHADRGYIWSFNERKNGTLSGSGIKNCFAEARLERKYSQSEGKKTCVNATYIHTWTRFAGSPKFSISGGVPSMEVTNDSYSWPIELSVPGLYY